MSVQVSACSACGGRNMPGHLSYKGSGLCFADSCPRRQVRGHHCARHILSLDSAANKVLPVRKCVLCGRDATLLLEAHIDLHTYMTTSTSTLKDLLASTPTLQDDSPQAPLPIVLAKKVPGSRKRPARPRGFHRVKRPALNHPFGPNPRRSLQQTDNVLYLGGDSDLFEHSAASRTALLQQHVDSQVAPVTTTPTPVATCGASAFCLNPRGSNGFCHWHKAPPNVPVVEPPPPARSHVAVLLPKPTRPTPPIARCTYIGCLQPPVAVHGLCLRHAPGSVHQCCNVFCTQPATTVNGYCLAHASLSTDLHQRSALCSLPSCTAKAVQGGEAAPQPLCALHCRDATSRPSSVKVALPSNAAAGLLPVCQHPLCKNVASAANNSEYCPLHVSFNAASSSRVDGCIEVADHAPHRPPQPPQVPTIKCKVRHCDIQAKSQGLCQQHYCMSAIPNAEPVEVNSVPLPPIVADPGAHQPVVAPVVPNSTSGAKHTVTICKVPSCGRMALIFGHCRSHYNSLRCTYPRCKELQNGDTYCAAHERATAQRDQVRVKLESPLSGGAPHASEGATMHGYCSRQDNLHQDVPTEPTGALATPAPTSAGYGEAVDNFPSVSSAPETSTPSTVVPSAVAQIAAAIDTILEPVSPQENTVADETPPTSSETATTCGATASGYCGDHMPIPTKVVPSLCKTPKCLFRPKTNGFCQKHFIESRTTNSAPVVTSNQASSQAASSPDAGSSQGGNRTEGTTNASSVSVPRILCKHLDCLQHAATDAEYCPVHKQLPNLFSSSTTPNTSQDSQGQSIPHSSTKLDTDPNTRNDNVKVCKVGGCVVSAKTQGFCRGHALTNQASVCDSAVPHIDNMPATCKAAGCSVVAKSKGYCRRHGNQIEQQAPQPPATVDLTSDDSPTTSVTANRTSYERCSVTGCRLKVKLNGMCRVHYYTPTMCQVSGCLFRSKMAGFCTIHAPASSK